MYRKPNWNDTVYWPPACIGDALLVRRMDGELVTINCHRIQSIDRWEIAGREEPIAIITVDCGIEIATAHRHAMVSTLFVAWAVDRGTTKAVSVKPSPSPAVDASLKGGAA